MYRYAAQNVDPETTSRASAREIPVKPKFAINVMKAIKGLAVEDAKDLLEDVLKLKRAIPFRTHKRHVKHRRGKVGPGAYPVKTSTAVLRVLKDAESNAEYKGLDPEKMYVWHACAHRGSPIPGTMPRAHGRATQWDTQTSHLEIVLKEREAGADEGEKKTEKEGEKPAKKAGGKKTPPAKKTRAGKKAPAKKVE